MSFKEEFASTLRDERIAEEMTQAAVAKAVGVVQPTVAQWETARTLPVRPLAIKLAEMFKGLRKFDADNFAEKSKSPGNPNGNPGKRSADTRARMAAAAATAHRIEKKGKQQMAMKLNQDGGVTMLAIGSLDAAYFNPPGRTKESAIESLVEDVRRAGVLSPVHVVPHRSRFIIADGHRRHAASLALGLSHVPCIVHHDCDPSGVRDLWARLNRNCRSVSSYDWMYAWLASGANDKWEMPPIVRDKIKICLEVFGGKSGIKKLIERGISPSIGWRVVQVHTGMNQYGINSISRTEIGEWIIQHKGSASVCYNLCKRPNSYGFKKLVSRIKRNKPFLVSDLDRPQRGTDAAA